MGPAGRGHGREPVSPVRDRHPADGRISARRLIRTSGTSEFDQSVEQAINRSSFPPLPPAFGGQEDRPIMAFSYNDLSRR
ncbi:MAG: TonB C-terminal domain-containing protein [Deltaproteobacteria bacterium]|nr:TonB C-terminal domain-containing protein [Deltaproteobacteria bacterium]